MNLSCGKCKAIRSFQGQARTCRCASAQPQTCGLWPGRSEPTIQTTNQGTRGQAAACSSSCSSGRVWLRVLSSRGNKVPVLNGAIERSINRECVEPENPYSEGTGHYAGYEWAERNGSSAQHRPNHSMRAARSMRRRNLSTRNAKRKTRSRIHVGIWNNSGLAST